MIKRNFIESICNFYMINYKQFCYITEIPYRTMQNWLYEKRKMPEYMEKLIYNTFCVEYGSDVHDIFYLWYYTTDIKMPIVYKLYTESIIKNIEQYNAGMIEYYCGIYQ